MTIRCRMCDKELDENQYATNQLTGNHEIICLDCQSIGHATQNYRAFHNHQ